MTELGQKRLVSDIYRYQPGEIEIQALGNRDPESYLIHLSTRQVSSMESRLLGAGI
jgi:hypothetical protein